MSVSVHVWVGSVAPFSTVEKYARCDVFLNTLHIPVE